MNSPRSDLRPVVHSARLRAEPVEKLHASAMVRVLADHRIYIYLSDEPPTLQQLERRYEFLSGGSSPDGSELWLTWVLVPRQTGAAPIGFLQATVKEPETAHIAYVIAPEYWRQGYAREALSALLDCLFERYVVERAIAEMDTRNEASAGLVRALGFRHVRTVQDVTEFKGSTSHEHVFEVTKAEWSSGERQRRAASGPAG